MKLSASGVDSSYVDSPWEDVEVVGTGAIIPVSYDVDNVGISVDAAVRFVDLVYVLPYTVDGD